MKTIHIKRALLWSKLLMSSLSVYWIKHPKHTYAIFRFFYKKLLAVPTFLKKNVKTEEEEKSFTATLKETQLLYKKIGRNFNAHDLKTYKKLEKVLHDRSQLLYFIVRSAKPNVFVETGVAAGKSTGFILQAMEDNNKGKLYSIDLPFQWYTYGKNNELHLDSLPPGQTPGYLVPKKLRKRWNLILGDTYQETPKLIKRLKKVDIFLHDSEHTDKTMSFEYNTSWPKLTKKGLLLSDDINFTHAFQDFAFSKSKLFADFNGLGILVK